MIDALLEKPEVREAFARYCRGEGTDKDLLSAIVTALAAQPEGETLEQAAKEMAVELYHDDDYGYCREAATCQHCRSRKAAFERTASRYLKVAAPILTAKLHARVATLEAERDTEARQHERLQRIYLAQSDTLRTVTAERDRLRDGLVGAINTETELATVEAERDTLREALGPDASGRSFPDLLRRVADYLHQLGGGPMEDCLRLKADQVDAALTRGGR